MILETLKALSDPSRLRLTAILMHGEFTVQELTRIMGMGQSKVSWHLKILTDAALLTVKRQGTWSYYRIGETNRFFSAIREAVEGELVQLPEHSADLAAVAAVLEDRRRKSQEFFDLHARQWDELSRTLLPVPDYRDRLLAAVPAGVKLLEIGVGTGALLVELAGRARDLVGVDHSPAMLEEARRRLLRSGISGIDLRLGEMAHLPLPDRSVECVIANMVLHHAADPLAVINEAGRVLAAGGLLLIADLARHEREAARDQLADQWLGFGEEELAGWLKSAGFADVAFERIEGKGGQESVLVVTATTPQPPPQ
jgi:ubiquinone/menaquinone biosynthesis C-methylase UbiE